MYFNELVASFDNERKQRDIFHDLMRKRVHEVLLVASLYDAFILETDGNLSDQIYGEFFRLNLQSSPRISCAYTHESAKEMASSRNFDMVIIMAGLEFDSAILLASVLKNDKPTVPVILLAMNNYSLSGFDSTKLEKPGLFDRVFVWNGYSKLFVGMVKYVEDLNNVDNDTSVGMVRVVLLIEDSVRYYSRYLPLLYSVVMKQTQQLVEEETSVETYKILRMRGRPKVLLATNYEEAMALYKRYEPYILTVISDVRFKREGVEDPEAGFRFLMEVKKNKKDLPVMIQSSEKCNCERAYKMGASFVDKNSNTLAQELSKFFQSQLGFGSFVFRNAEGKEVAKARNMNEFLSVMQTLEAGSLMYHAEHRHFSSWLIARGEVRYAKIMRNYVFSDFDSPDSLRDFICRALLNLKIGKEKGVIPSISDSGFDTSLIRLGGGSVGGKGRGLAFIKSLIDNAAFPRNPGDMEIRLANTAFIGIDEFEYFMESNNLWDVALRNTNIAELRSRMIANPLRTELVNRLRTLVSKTNKPLAVRSSGLFEDMLLVPFSGVYDTYLIPNSDKNIEVRLLQLCDAIKMIYASLYSPQAKSYFESASYKIEEERMAVIVEELVGRPYGKWYYPLIAGTAQSYNYYPVSYIKPEDGLCVAALGLGPYVVDGGEAFRFSPRYPKLDVVAPNKTIGTGTQRWFYALDLEKTQFNLLQGEEATLTKLDISEAENNPAFSAIASTWSFEDDRLEPGISKKGPRIIDFAPALKYNAFPFASVVDNVLDICSKSMGLPVELEYAISPDGENGENVFYLLQIKPMIRPEDRVHVDLSSIKKGTCLVASSSCMGNGKLSGIKDVVFVDMDKWNRAETEEIAFEIESLNKKLKQDSSSYVLIGPGRWGTRDKWLGIPVSFSQISCAKVIVEANIPSFSVESSLGSHFFHNVTAMNIGYFTVSKENSFVDWTLLSSLTVCDRTKHCIHAKLDKDLSIEMDGRQGKGIITL